MLSCSIFKCCSVIERAENKTALGFIKEPNRVVTILNKSLGRQSNDLIVHRIIIIIWHYKPLWVFDFSAKSLQVILPLVVSFQL
jgi:hypothetical protein